MMSSFIFPPGLILIAGAFILMLLRGRARQGVVLLLPLLTLAYAWLVIGGEHTLVLDSLSQYLGFTLTPVVVNPFTRVFATVFCIMAGAGTLFALQQKNRVELPAAMIYAGGAICVTFAGDLLTMFVFWEIMTLGSTVVIWSTGTQPAFRAGMRYFGLHAIGGVVLLAGIILHATQLQAVSSIIDPYSFSSFKSNMALANLTMGHLGWDNFAAWMILAGMLLNAGAPPFSAWIPDAYPEASESGTVFLSAYTTKTAVFTLMVAFAGTHALIYIGAYMAVYGIVYAILENDMRRILAYSIVNQVGFMLCGIGIGSELALNGAAAHAFAHIIYKALLLMSAGSVLYMTGKRKCTNLGGLYRTMPLTMICGTIGALAISAFPLTSGFVSKTMINLASTRLDHHTFGWVWFVLEAASAGVFLHAGIKFPWFVFFQKDSGLRPPEPPWNMQWAMVFFAVLCVGIGIPGLYQPLYGILPFAVGATADSPTYFAPYESFGHIVAQLELLLFAGLAFFVLLPVLKRTETITLDWDYLYRRLIPGIWQRIGLPLLRGLHHMGQRIAKGIPQLAFGDMSETESHTRLPRPWTVSRTVLLITVILLVYLVVDYLQIS